MQIFNTIRFKLTLWYSLMLFAIAAIFVLSLNLVMAQILLSEPQIQTLPLVISQRLPARWVDFSQDQQELITQLREIDLANIRSVSILSLIPITIGSFIAGYIIAGYMLRPIEDINKTAARITAENLQMRIPDTGVDDELGELIYNFNLMLDRLESSFELQQQFIESASHELKTPLAVIRTNLETTLADKKSSKKDMSTAINVAMGSVEQMNKLVEDLLLLSHQSANMEKQRLDLTELVSELVAGNQELANQHQVNIELEATKGIKIDANQFYLARAINNLIENAIKYSGKGEVKVSILENRDKVVVKVDDQGPGILAKEQEKIFERFYRIDKSRSRKMGGSGLGLPITKKIVEDHGGDISVASKRGKGSTFKIELPRSV